MSSYLEQLLSNLESNRLRPYHAEPTQQEASNAVHVTTIQAENERLKEENEVLYQRNKALEEHGGGHRRHLEAVVQERDAARAECGMRCINDA